MMIRFEDMRERVISGGVDNRPPADRAGAPRDSIFIPASPPLERSQFTQTAIDILAALGAFLFVTVTGLGIAFSALCLLFVTF